MHHNCRFDGHSYTIARTVIFTSNSILLKQQRFMSPCILRNKITCERHLTFKVWPFIDVPSNVQNTVRPKTCAHGKST